MKKYILSLQFGFIALFLVAIPTQSDAQLYEILEYIKKAKNAHHHIGQLKEGTLIVRLQSKKNNIEALEKSLAQGDLNASERRRLEKKLAYMISNRNHANKEIIAGLEKHYQFSEYRIVYDSDISQVFDQTDKGYFLNRDQEIDPSISIDLTKPFYILGYGLTSIATNYRREGFIFSDQYRNHLENPFPHLIHAAYPPFSSLIAFFGAGDTVQPNYIKMIKRTNIKLNKLYTRARIKEQKNNLMGELKDLKKGN